MRKNPFEKVSTSLYLSYQASDSDVGRLLDQIQGFQKRRPDTNLGDQDSANAAAVIGNHFCVLIRACGHLNSQGHHSACILLLRPLQDAIDVFAAVTTVPGSARGWMENRLNILEHYCDNEGVDYHALRTRRAGARRFVSVHVQVPGEWSVQAGHDLMEEIEADLRRMVPHVSVFTHLEPLEDPRSWHDIELQRAVIE